MYIITMGKKRGQPAIYGKRMEKRLNVRLPPDMLKWVNRQSRRLKITPGRAARLAVKAAMKSGKDLELDKADGTAKGGN